MIIKRTEEFDLAYRFVTETNQNIFLTGKAGTGKTTFLKYLRSNSVKNIVVAAPTGVAAINARGVTLHSLFQLPFGVILPGLHSFEGNDHTSKNHPLLSKIHYNKDKLYLLQSLELLVIDETSMVASYIVDAIDTILRYVRRKPHQLFGGVQLLFIGDLYQLPPVVKKEEWEILQNFYSSVFFFDSLILRDNIPVTIELKEIFRQKDDRFIEVLNGIRNNNITEENFLLLNSRLNNNFMSNDNEGYITLTTHNYQSDEINKRKLNNLFSRPFVFHAEINGEFPEHNFPAEKELNLKSGAQVMFLKNDTEGKQYFNGKIGIITELSGNTIKVKCKDEPDEIEVKKCEWQNINYKVNPDTREIKEEVLGNFIQYPLRLAWAITIHKSQGLTFDKIVIDAEKAFATGQVYVALSRCTSLEGLVLRSPVYRNFLGAHRDLKEWHNKNRETNLSQQFFESRQNFILQELQNIFTWKNWYYLLKALNEFLFENQIKIPANAIQWITGLMEKQKELYEISEKFKQLIIKLKKENPLVEENEILQKRTKDAANYFYNEISRWAEGFINHPISVETKKLSRKIDSLLEDINFTIHEILYKINYCRNGFILDDYLKAAKSFQQSGIKNIYSSNVNNKIAELSPEDTPHPELYWKLIEMRNEIANKSALPLYMILSNKSIVNVCINLPLNTGELSKVKGFKKAKISIYGEKIISLVKEYCSTNNIVLSQQHNYDYDLSQGIKPNTVEETVHFLREGKTVDQIAIERKLVVSTIEGHLAQAIKKDLIQIEEVIQIEEARKISEYFPEDLNNIQLSPIKEKVPPEVTYGKLKMVLAWMHKGKC